MSTHEAFTPSAAQKVLINGEVMCYTAGVSMYPMLRQGKDIVVVKQVGSGLKKHDVVLYLRNHGTKPVLHRIIRIRRDGSLVIRGDNTYKNELDISREDIIGVLVGFYRGGRYIDCERSRAYIIYVCLMRAFYPARWMWHRAIRPTLSKIKRFVLNKK